MRLTWFDDTFSLAGQWRIARAIRPHARFHGVATVTREADDDYLWREAGALVLPDRRLSNTHRAYRYRIDPLTKSVTVLYADGAQAGDLLHAFTPDEMRHGAMRHTHQCPPDTYRALLRIESADKFRLSYVIEGPRKNYSIASICERI